MTDIHSCSYYCTRPACVLAQRDEMRDKLMKQAEPVVSPIDRDVQAELRVALHRISLASQNSMSSKEECGRIARNALHAVPDQQAEPVVEPVPAGWLIFPKGEFRSNIAAVEGLAASGLSVEVPVYVHLPKQAEPVVEQADRHINKA